MISLFTHAIHRSSYCTAFLFSLMTAAAGDSPSPAGFDVLIKGGTVYDGTGSPGCVADVAIGGDRIVGVGDFQSAIAKTVIDAPGLAVAPGFINMLSWSVESLMIDGRSQSELRQGVTTEIFGEGESMGPVNDRVREHMLREQTDFKFDITWSTLSDYLKYLEKRGVSCNIASYIGATTIRENVIGFEDKAPTAEQLDEMRELVRQGDGDGRARHWLGLDLSARFLC
jgi:N-acyl-D-amino-acid deacylase